MGHHIIQYDCICTDCKGTGIYVGLAERDVFGVVCYQCKGTGKTHEIIEYDDFEGKAPRKDIAVVLKVNPGVVLKVNPGIVAGINPEEGLTSESFGGMPYEDWFEGRPFPPKSEMRLFTCPAWWYQSADYDKKPDWDWCRGLGAFSACDHFEEKDKCWDRFDKENIPSVPVKK